MSDTTTAPLITWTRRYDDREGEIFSTNFVIDDMRIYLKGSRWPRRHVKTRVYISGEPKVDFTEAEEASRAAGTFNRGNVEADKLWDAGNRAVVRSKKEFVEALIHTIPVLGEILSDHKLNFNKKAGCACGCSPGFIADGRLTMTTTVPTYKGEETATLIMLDVSAYKIKKEEATA